MSKELKQIRGQLRQIVNELMPELLTKELENALFKVIQESINARLSNIEGQIKTDLNRINEQQKNLQNYILRQSVVTTANSK